MYCGIKMIDDHMIYLKVYITLNIRKTIKRHNMR